jgi:hypothetical protein
MRLLFTLLRLLPLLLGLLLQSEAKGQDFGLQRGEGAVEWAMSQKTSRRLDIRFTAKDFFLFNNSENNIKFVAFDYNGVNLPFDNNSISNSFLPCHTFAKDSIEIMYLMGRKSMIDKGGRYEADDDIECPYNNPFVLCREGSLFRSELDGMYIWLVGGVSDMELKLYNRFTNEYIAKNVLDFSNGNSIKLGPTECEGVLLFRNDNTEGGMKWNFAFVDNNLEEIRYIPNKKMIRIHSMQALMNYKKEIWLTAKIREETNEQDIFLAKVGFDGDFEFFDIPEKYGNVKSIAPVGGNRMLLQTSTHLLCINTEKLQQAQKNIFAEKVFQDSVIPRTKLFIINDIQDSLNTALKTFIANKIQQDSVYKKLIFNGVRLDSLGLTDSKTETLFWGSKMSESRHLVYKPQNNKILDSIAIFKKSCLIKRGGKADTLLPQKIWRMLLWVERNAKEIQQIDSLLDMQMYKEIFYLNEGFYNLLKNYKATMYVKKQNEIWDNLQLLQQSYKEVFEDFNVLREQNGIGYQSKPTEDRQYWCSVGSEMWLPPKEQEQPPPKEKHTRSRFVLAITAQKSKKETADDYTVRYCNRAFIDNEKRHQKLDDLTSPAINFVSGYNYYFWLEKNGKRYSELKTITRNDFLNKVILVGHKLSCFADIKAALPNATPKQLEEVTNFIMNYVKEQTDLSPAYFYEIPILIESKK